MRKFTAKKNMSVYLDYAAAAPINRRVAKVMEALLRLKIIGNPSSIHTDGLAARAMLDDARRKVSALIGASPYEIIFTSGGTESNNLAISGVVSSSAPSHSHLITSVVEHPSILEVCRSLHDKGARLSILPVNECGRISAEKLQGLLDKQSRIITLALVNGELGTISPIRRIVKIVKKFRQERQSSFPYIHLDCSHAAATMSINVSSLGVDLMTLDGAKIGAPAGIGILYVKDGVKIFPHMHGGGQEGGKRSGSQNLLGAIAFAEALSIALSVRKVESARLTELKNYFIPKLLALRNSASINGDLENSSPAIVNVCLPGIDSEYFVVALDDMGIRSSSASACVNLSDDASSHVIAALPGKGKMCSSSSLRFSFGQGTSRRHLDRCLNSLKILLRKNRSRSDLD